MKIYPKASSENLEALTQGYENENKVFFPNLDGLRFIAFFLVFLAHGFGNLLGSVPTDGLLQRLLGLVFQGGGIGVSFFFVLSGFLITYLIIREVHLIGKLDVISFYIRRMLRIWPLYYLVLAFGFLAYPMLKSLSGYSPYVETGKFIYYALFLGNFDVINLGHGRGAMSINITWSVAIEEQFYLLWPLLFFFIKPQYYKYIFPTIILGSALFRFSYANDGMTLYFHTFSVISDMALGGLIAYLAISKSRIVLSLVTIKRPIIVMAYIIGILGLAYLDVLFAPSVGLAAVLSRLFSTAFFAFIILEQNYAAYSFFKMKNFVMISRLGKYTYGLYLLHPIAIQLVIITTKVLHLGRENRFGTVVTGLIALGLSLVMSITSFHLYEKPFLKLKPRFSHIITGTRTGKLKTVASPE